MKIFKQGSNCFPTYLFIQNYRAFLLISNTSFTQKILIFSPYITPILSTQRTKKRTEEMSETTSEHENNKLFFTDFMQYTYTILKSIIYRSQFHN